MFFNKYLINIAVIIKAVLIAYPSIAAEGSGMPQMVIPDFMPQLVWLIVVFSLLYFSMKYVALPRITEIISNRDLKIVNDLEKAEEIKKQIEQTNKEHQDAVDDTNNKIKIIVNEINKKLEQCQNDINKKIQEEKIKLEKELEEFNKNIEKIASESVEAIIQKMYYVKPDNNNLKNIVNKYSESYNNE